MKKLLPLILTLVCGVTHAGVVNPGSGNAGATGPTGPTGPTGATGVVSATIPLAYNSGTKTVSLATSVKSYGAVGDGTTDDTTAVNAALAASVAVYFPAGNYVVSNLTIQNGQFLFGDGVSSILTYKTGSTGYLIYGNGAGYSVSHLAVAGGNSVDYSATGTQGTRSCFHIDALQSNQLFDGVYVDGFNNIAFAANGNTTVSISGPTITNCYVSNCYAATDTGPGGTGQNTLLSGINGGEYLKFVDNSFIHCKYGCLVDSGNVLWTGNVIQLVSFPLYINPATNAPHGAFTGNIVNHAASQGVYANTSNTQDYTISGNTFRGNKSGVWTIDRMDSLLVTGNIIEGGQMVFSNGGGHDHISFVNNSFYTNSPIIQNKGATVIWSGNWSTGEINNVQQLSPLLIDSNYVTYTPTYTPTGSNLINDSSFAVAGNSIWTSYSGGWTIAGNGHADSAGSGLIGQAITGSQNDIYLLTFTLTATSNGVYFGFGGGSTPVVTGTGVHTVYIQRAASTNILWLFSSSYVGQITGISLVKVIPSAGTLNLGTINASLATASTLAGFDSNKNLVSKTAGTDYSLITVQTGALVAGVKTFTVPSGCHPWAQDNASSLANIFSLSVTVSGTTATVTSTSITDTSIVTLYNAGSQ